MARNGKIARCPESVREELNQRLRSGELGPQILPWINSLPEVQAVLADFFAGQPINAQNLSDWRCGGFADWQEKKDKTDRIKELATFAAKISDANCGHLAAGASAIASGKILELLESFDADTDGKADADKPSALDQLGDLVQCVASLRAGDMAQQRAQIDREKLKQKDQELSLANARFQRDTCALFVKWSADQRAIAIANGAADNATKIELLGQIMFGADWKSAS